MDDDSDENGSGGEIEVGGGVPIESSGGGEAGGEREVPGGVDGAGW